MEVALPNKKIFQGLIRLLSACASGSPLGSKTLLLLGISGILKDILSGSGHAASMYVSPALSRPPEQVILNAYLYFFFSFSMLINFYRFSLTPYNFNNRKICNQSV